MKGHLFYVLMDRTSPIHECKKCLNTNAKSVFKPYSVRSEGCTSCTSVLQEIINTFGSSVPEATTAFGTFFELMCGPRGIAAAVDAKNMPPACFLNAPTVLQEIICFSSRTSKTQKPQRFLGFLFSPNTVLSQVLYFAIIVKLQSLLNFAII